MSQLQQKDEEWWTPEKEECLELLLKGVAKLQIAKQLNLHRNTINNWCSHPTFQAEARTRMQEHRDRVQNRRTMESEVFTNLSAKYAMEAAKDLEQNPKDERARRTFREFAQEWRESVREEREVLGTNVRRIGVEAHVTSEVRHEIGSTFKDALLERVRSGKLIDVEAVVSESKDPMQTVQSLTRKLLTSDPSVLEAIQASDAQAEQEAEATKKRRK